MLRVPSINDRKVSSSVSVGSNKCETINSTVCQSKANVLKAKTVNAIHDGSNIVCVSCGKDVLMLSHEKCVARYALSVDSRVKRALFTSPIAAKSRNLGATSVVAKSKFSVAKTPTATNKVVSSASSLSLDSRIVRFGNDHFAAITGYGDYVQGNLTICHVYYVEGLRHNLFLVRQFCDGDLEVAFLFFLHTKDEAPNMIINSLTHIQRSLKAHILKVRSDNRTEFKNEKLRTFYAKLGITHNTSTVRMPQQNGVVKRRNRTLVEATRTMLIFSKASNFLWAEAIATACFTHNLSLVHTRYNKTPYELIKGRKPNVQYFHMFGSLCYPTNDRDDLGK
ncbi:retrovirus-related pol polyprotein from transposon TNT 1-94 [Tanacetum coccineum]